MKRLFSIVLMVICVMSIPLSVFAQSAEKIIDITLSTSALEIKAGETVILTAVSEKHGSSFTDTWTGAKDTSTILNTNTHMYTSTATFTSNKPGIYKITYNIRMTAGNSNNTFTGTAVKTITVVSPVTVTGADIRNISISIVRKADGSISGYSAIGNIYILRSDNTSSLYGTTFFFYRPDEISKNISVKLNIQNTIYEYIVTVNRGL